MNEQQHHILDIEKAADRDTVTVILARNGYTVRHGKRKKSATGSASVYFVEYWREEAGDGGK